MSDWISDLVDGDPLIDDREQLFHNTVREYVIFLLFFLALLIFSYIMLRSFLQLSRDDLLDDIEDATVFRMSIGLCTFSLAVAVGAALLLPISIISNEVLLLYPNSYYIKWLNSSLVQGLWNLIFLFSNLSLFIFLPFTYLFTEAEGFFGHRKGLLGKVVETLVVLALLAMVVIALACIITALFDGDGSSRLVLFDVWSSYLPFIYSCVAFIGVLMLQVCTPIGLGRIFTVVGRLVVKPQFLRDVSEEHQMALLEEQSLQRKIEQCNGHVAKQRKPQIASNGKRHERNGVLGLSLINGSKYKNHTFTLKRDVEDEYHDKGLSIATRLQQLNERLAEVTWKRKELDRIREVPALRRTLGYPLAMLILLFLTAVAGLLVVHNTLQLLVGIKALPLHQVQTFNLGLASLSLLGPPGAALEVVLILYLLAASLLGLYTLPIFTNMRPRLHATSLTQLVLNCVVVLVLSSALPLLARILGITNFDLLGHFGRVEWLGNFWLVLLYNLAFAASCVLCLANQFTTSAAREIWKRLQTFCAPVLQAFGWMPLLLKARNN